MATFDDGFRWFGRPFSQLMPQLKALALKRRSPSRRGQEHPRYPLPFSLALSQQFWLPEKWIKVVWTTGPALKIFNGWKVTIAKNIELFKLGKEVQLVNCITIFEAILMTVCCITYRSWYIKSRPRSWFSLFHFDFNLRAGHRATAFTNFYQLKKRSTLAMKTWLTDKSIKNVLKDSSPIQRS